MAYINDLFGKHKDELEQFRNRIQDVLPVLKSDFHRSDLSLFKYLVARDFDLDKAEQMLREHLKWREQNKIDHICEAKIPEEVEEGFPVVLCGRDKRGCPVIYQPVGKWKWRQGARMNWKELLQKLLWQRGERLAEKCADISKGGQPVVQNYGIFDLEGYDYTQIFSLELNRMKSEIFKDYLDNYPEVMSAIRIINAPKLFQLIWAWLEPILTGRTISKLEIYGCNKEEWKARLLEEVGPDNLPSCLGGSLTACFPYKVEAGVNVDPRYELLPEDRFKEIVVAAGKNYVVDLNLQPGMQLIWNFKADEYDIGFQVELDGKQSIIDYSRVDAHKYLQKGLIACNTMGKYTLTFDNSYSKFKRKTLRLALEVKNGN